MSRSRKGWRQVKFGEVVRLVTERCDPVVAGIERFVGLEHLEPGSLRVRSWGSVAGGTTFTTRFRPGQLLFGKRRAYQRKVAVADFEGVCSGDIYVLESRDPATLQPEFLPFLCQTDDFFEHAIGTSAGSLSPRTNWTRLAEYEFPLPPMEEQRKLASVLRSALGMADTLVDAVGAADATEAALLLSEFGPYRDEDASVLPKLRSLATVCAGIAKGRRHEPGRTVEMPYLRVANVKDGHLDLTEVQTIVVEKGRVSQYLLRRGDVLMTEGGDLDKLGRGTVWQEELPRCVHQNHVFAVRTDPARLDPWYLAALARSAFGRGYFQRCAKRTSNLASVNKRELGNCPIPLTGLAEQAQFVQRWRSLREARADLTRRLELLRGTFKTPLAGMNFGASHVH